MLVLARKVQEKIYIGENITITVLKVQGRSVRIGIDAPRNLRVIRAEIPLDVGQRTAPGATFQDGTEQSDAAPIESLEAASSDTPRPIVIGRRFRVIAPSTPGTSMLQAIPIS